jgi:TPR repeat protein
MHRIVGFCIAIGLTALMPALSASSSHADGNLISESGNLHSDSFHKVADQDSARAEEKIGDLFWQGAADHPRNRTEAVHHYGNAAKFGIPSAERKLAIAYANGEGAPPDDARMLHWQRKAAEAGDPVAAGMLGYAIMIGLDGTYDMVEAATWLTLAAENHGAADAWRSQAATYASDAKSRLTPTEREAFQARLAHWRSILNGG